MSERMDFRIRIYFCLVFPTFFWNFFVYSRLSSDTGGNWPTGLSKIDLDTACPKVCTCRPKAPFSLPAFDNSGSGDLKKFIEGFIEQNEWTATCEIGNISTFGSRISSGQALSLAKLPRRTVDLSLKFNKLKHLHRRTFSALPNLQIL